MGLGYLYPDTPERDALSRSMMGYWANFARTGKPGKGSSGAEPEWLAWGDGDNRMIVLDTTNDAGIHMSDEEVSMASIKTLLASDTSITSNETRCRLYVQSFARNEAFDMAAYKTFGPEGCAGFDPAGFAFE